jgi:DNA-binding NarL/FixJ family response regulator
VSVVRVLAVDDQLVFRLALRRLIAATPGFEQVGEAASGEEALRLVPDLRPDLGLVDVRMPEMDGFETARRLAEVDSKLVIVLISIEDTARLVPPFAERAVAAHVRKRDLSTRTLRDLWAQHTGGGPP